jgi:hypothetical protein
MGLARVGFATVVEKSLSIVQAVCRIRSATDELGWGILKYTPANAVCLPLSFFGAVYTQLLLVDPYKMHIRNSRLPTIAQTAYANLSDPPCITERKVNLV